MEDVWRRKRDGYEPTLIHVDVPFSAVVLQYYITYGAVVFFFKSTLTETLRPLSTPLARSSWLERSLQLSEDGSRRGRVAESDFFACSMFRRKSALFWREMEQRTI